MALKKYRLPGSQPLIWALSVELGFSEDSWVNPVQPNPQADFRKHWLPSSVFCKLLPGSGSCQALEEGRWGNVIYCCVLIPHGANSILTPHGSRARTSMMGWKLHGGRFGSGYAETGKRPTLSSTGAGCLVGCGERQSKDIWPQGSHGASLLTWKLPSERQGSSMYTLGVEDRGLALPPASCVMSGKLLHLSVSVSSSVK